MSGSLTFGGVPVERASVKILSGRLLGVGLDMTSFRAGCETRRASTTDSSDIGAAESNSSQIARNRPRNVWTRPVWAFLGK